MIPEPAGYQKVLELLEKGVTAPNPGSLDIGEEVDLDRISGDGVVLEPGCRIHGAKTVVSAGCRLGAEGPVVIDDCRLGPGVELKGGYFKKSVFLEKANMGLGAQVREACLLEEEANGAHCVGLKQTILFPFVTLGSLINFCDCLMAGGTSRKDHSEVGSSYIHFNYTPDGDKTTPSLFGDVPRGVMLDQPAIFLGGQGGAVGPVRVGFGSVVAAGSVLRHDVEDDRMLVFDATPGGIDRVFEPHSYSRLVTIVRNNVIFVANLVALEQWYRKVRHRFFTAQDLGELVYEGALEMLSLAKAERLKRIEAMAAKVPTDTGPGAEFVSRAGELAGAFADEGLPAGDDFLAAVQPALSAGTGNYTETVQALDPAVKAAGVDWLEQIVDTLCERADGLLISMDLFGKRG